MTIRMSEVINKRKKKKEILNIVAEFLEKNDIETWGYDLSADTSVEHDALGYKTLQPSGPTYVSINLAVTKRKKPHKKFEIE